MQFLRDHWYPIAVAAELETPKAVRLLSTDLVVWPAGEAGPVTSEPFCPHRSAHLAQGWLHDGELVCPYHGWRFGADGRCTHVPQMEDHLPVPTAAKLVTYPTVERYGLIWTCLGQSPVDDKPPRWEEAEEHPDWRFRVEFFETWRAAAPRIIDNNLDQSHVAYVHRDTFGDPDDSLLPDHEIVSTPTGFATRMTMEHRGVAAQSGATSDEAIRLERTTEVELVAPLVSRTRLHYGGANPDYCFFSPICPIDDDHSVYVRLTALAGDEAVQPWSIFHAFGTRVKDEDRRVLETTSRDFPVDVTTEVHLRSDRLTLEYRRHLRALSEESRSTPVTVAGS
jgi:phenylpropionate dioxygenase-like ring-hydroxylating dioxygenase large terminal subunit